MAVFGNHVATVALLLKYGAVRSLNTANNRACTPLLEASISDYREIASLLIAAGADVNLGMKRDGLTALVDACRKGQARFAALLLDAGARVDLPADNGVTPLCAAAQNDHVGTLRLLLERGALPDGVGGAYAHFPLMCACREGHVASARILLEYCADVNAATRTARRHSLLRPATTTRTLSAHCSMQARIWHFDV